MDLILYTDGGSRGNPGLGAAGVVLYDEKNSDHPLEQHSIFLADHITNNEAEYRALIIGLTRAAMHNPDCVQCFLDSELVVKQLNGEYRVKDDKLRLLYSEVCAFRETIPVLEFRHVPRKENAIADALVNQALDAVGDDT